MPIWWNGRYSFSDIAEGTAVHRQLCFLCMCTFQEPAHRNRCRKIQAFFIYAFFAFRCSGNGPESVGQSVPATSLQCRRVSLSLCGSNDQRICISLVSSPLKPDMADPWSSSMDAKRSCDVCSQICLSSYCSICQTSTYILVVFPLSARSSLTICMMPCAVFLQARLSTDMVRTRSEPQNYALV